jgi:3-oxoacyl-[acyl-carrier protein] reductase
MKNILLIGGSYGIGLAIAKELVGANTIYIASRTAEGLENLNVTHIPYDASTDSLDTLFYLRYRRFGILSRKY